MADLPQYGQAIWAPSGQFEPATTDTTFTEPTRGIIVGTGGSMTVVRAKDDAQVTIVVPAGVLPLRIKRIVAAGLTAANITLLF